MDARADSDEQVVLEELYDENYEPTEAGGMPSRAPRDDLDGPNNNNSTIITSICCPSVPLCVQRFWSMPNGWVWIQTMKR